MKGNRSGLFTPAYVCIYILRITNKSLFIYFPPRLKTLFNTHQATDSGKNKAAFDMISTTVSNVLSPCDTFPTVNIARAL